MNTVIICAAGSGTRLKRPIPKALVPVNNKPMFYWAVKAFGEHPEINNILILAPKAHIGEFQTCIKKFADGKIQKKIIGILAGGQERQDSVYRGVVYLHQSGLEKDSVVLVHNAANIFVTPQEIGEIIKNINRGPASAIAIPSADTLREVNAKLAPVKKLDRSRIWRMQTPQGASLEILHKAYAKAEREGFYGTDDIELVERIKYPVNIVPGSPQNFKITYPEDLAIAESIIMYQNLARK